MKTIGEMTPEEFTSFLEAHGHQCLFGGTISPQDVALVVNHVRNLGKGNFAAGLEVKHENDKWVLEKRLEEKSNIQDTKGMVKKWLINGGLFLLALAVFEYLKKKFAG